MPGYMVANSYAIISGLADASFEEPLPNVDDAINDPALRSSSNSTRTPADGIAERSTLHAQSLPYDQLLFIGKIRYRFKIIRLRLNAPFHRVRSATLGITEHCRSRKCRD